VGSDLAMHPVVTRKLGLETDEARGKAALHAGRAAVIVLGGISWLVALSPPALVGIFGTIGTYGLLVASLPAVLYGVLLKRPPSAAGIGIASLVGLSVHLTLYLSGWTINTGLTATIALVVCLPIPFLVDALRRALITEKEPTHVARTLAGEMEPVRT